MAIRGGSLLNCTDHAVNPLSWFLSTLFCWVSIFVLPGEGLKQTQHPASELPLLPSWLWAGWCVLGSLWNIVCCSFWMLRASFVEMTAIRSNSQYWREVNEKWGEIKERGCKEQKDQQHEMMRDIWASSLSMARISTLTCHCVTADECGSIVH